MSFIRTLLTSASLRGLCTALCLAPPLLAACVAQARDDTPPEVREQVNRETLDEREIRYYAKQFRTKCARCHGADGAGGGAEAQAQAVPPTNLTDAAHMSSRSDGELFYQILMGGDPRCAMPAFGPDSDHGWSESKIWQMVAFVRRFAQPDPP